MLARHTHLSHSEARFILLAQTAKADGIITGAELRTAMAMYAELGLSDNVAERTMTDRIRSVSEEDVAMAIDTLAFAAPRERERSVQLLWVMAISDGELHAEQERFIYSVADRLGVSRRTVSLQQPDR